MTIPRDLRYTKEHEWLDLPGDSGDPNDSDDAATVGITAHAADALGDVVFVQLPAVGEALVQGGVCGEIESTKSVSELFAPVTGVVVEVNESVRDNPELVNADPYGTGWLFRLRVEQETTLLDAAAYAALVNEEA